MCRISLFGHIKRLSVKKCENVQPRCDIRNMSLRIRTRQEVSRNYYFLERIRQYSKSKCIKIPRFWRKKNILNITSFRHTAEEYVFIIFLIHFRNTHSNRVFILPYPRPTSPTTYTRDDATLSYLYFFFSVLRTT